MTYLYNDATDFRDEMMAGFLAAQGRYVKRVPDATGVLAVDAPTRGKVSLLSSGGAGVLYCYGNYSGDVLNFNMAQMHCRTGGLDVRTEAIPK